MWGAFEGELGSHSVYLCGLTFDTGLCPHRCWLFWVLECPLGSCKDLVLSLMRVEVLRRGTQCLGPLTSSSQRVSQGPSPFLAPLFAFWLPRGAQLPPAQCTASLQAQKLQSRSPPISRLDLAGVCCGEGKLSGSALSQMVCWTSVVPGCRR